MPDKQRTTRGQQRLQESSKVLVKISWSGAGEEMHAAFQLVDLAANKTQEQLRQEILAYLHALGRTNGSVEMFDPDNVPPGTIPSDASITENGPFIPGPSS